MPHIRNLCSGRHIHNIIRWSIVSNAADQSSRTKKAPYWVSSVRGRSLWIRSSAVSTLWQMWDSDCITSRILWAAGWWESWVATVFSNSLEVKDRFDTGDSFSTYPCSGWSSLADESPGLSSWRQAFCQQPATRWWSWWDEELVRRYAFWSAEWGLDPSCMSKGWLIAD